MDQAQQGERRIYQPEESSSEDEVIRASAASGERTLATSKNMRIAFEELSLRAGDAGYGFFAGEAELDSFGEPVSFDMEPTAKGRDNLNPDIANLARDRVTLRHIFGVAFLEDDAPEVREHFKK